MKKGWLVLVLCILMNYCVFAEEASLPKVKAQGAVLIDYSSGRVLWGKNENQPMAMASTTKIMTAILAIESGKLEEVVIASKRAASAPNVKMNLSVGEEHKLIELLYPLMMQSSNDAAIAIAEHIGGSVENFCTMMTEKAKELGCKNTVFETPNGLDSGNHHSTAYDMALITRYALNNETFREIIQTKEITIPSISQHSKSYTIVNKNRLLSEYEGAIGVKTGFTGKAGQCFVGAAQRDGMTLISVVLASGWGNSGKEQKWRDTKEILNYGFDKYERKDFISKGIEAGCIPVTHSKEGSIIVRYANDVSSVIHVKEEEQIKYSVLLPEVLDAPITKGQRVGTVCVQLETGEVLGQTDILADSTILRHDFKTSLEKIIYHWQNDTIFDILF